MEYSNIEQSNSSRMSNTRLSSQKITNTRLFDREMGDLNIKTKRLNPINRLEVERDEFMKSSNNIDEDDGDFDKFRQNGFTTNNNNKNYDSRMPMRSEYAINKAIYETDSNINNTRSSLKNISSYNPNSNLADIDADTKLSDNLQNNTTCINGINNYGLFLFENLLNIMNCAFVFCPYLIYTSFGSLYLGSDGNTEVELKNYFSFPRIDIISEGLKDVQLNLQKVNNNTNSFGNCIIFSDEIDYDPTFCSNINMFTKIRKVNKQNAEKESTEINMIIQKMCNISKKSITSDNIKNASVILLNYASISPTWTSYFSKTIKENNIDFMISYNQTFGYFDQPNLQVLEMTSIDNLAFGIIYGDIDLNDKNFKLITSSLKPTILEEVKIPKFKLQTKLRYTNILKETDLKTVFLDLNIPYLFKSESHISDCLQNIEFNLCENSVQNKKMSGLKTTKKFIVTKTFRFYLRSAINNCIILMGTF